MWHGAYVAWLEEARVEALAKAGVAYSELSARGLELPVVSLAIDYRRALLHGDAIGRGEEYGITGSQIGLGRIGENQIYIAAQTGEQIADRLSCFAARGDAAQFCLRMHGQQAQQLDPGVAGAANDTNFDFFVLHCLFKPNRIQPEGSGSS
jgi:hypothetical protein